MLTVLISIFLVPCSIFSAVREGFEPSVQFDPYGSLANYWFEPLTHLTVPTLFRGGLQK
jgi:hypothetical protein